MWLPVVAKLLDGLRAVRYGRADTGEWVECKCGFPGLTDSQTTVSDCVFSGYKGGLSGFKGGFSGLTVVVRATRVLFLGLTVFLGATRVCFFGLKLWLKTAPHNTVRPEKPVLAFSK